MTLLSPIAGLVAAGITLPLLVLLYFLKLRRRTVDVSTTMLWRRAIQDLQVNAPFQRLRRNLLLLLQLLILGGLLLALARPAFQQSGPPGQRMVILIDRSAPMNATDVKPSRLAQAKRVALQLIDEMPGAAQGATASAPGSVGGRGTSGGGGGGGGAMVIAFGRRPEVVQAFTSDPALLRTAIESIQPSDEAPELEPALRLIAPFAAAGTLQPLTVYLLSDGRVGDTTALTLPGADIKFVRIPGGGTSSGATAAAMAGASDATPGAAIDNLAIVDLAARRDARDPNQVHLYARLANYGSRRLDPHVTLRVDGQVQRVVQTFVPPAAPELGEPGTQSLEFTLDLPGSALVELAHDHPDQLGDDDHAAVLVTRPRHLRVLLVGPGNEPLERAIRAVGAQELEVMTPATYERQDPRRLRTADWPGAAPVGGEGFNVIVFDRYSPRQPPPVDSLFFGAVPPAPGLSIQPTPSGAGAGGGGGVGAGAGGHAQPVLDWHRNGPLLRYVDLDDVVLGDPGRLVLPDGAQVLATCQDGPVMAEMTVGGVNCVFTSFALDQARTWTMQVSFPVFMANALPWLGLGGRADAGVSYQPGGVAVVPAAGAEVRYEGPATLSAPVMQGHAVLPVFALAGIYRATPRSRVEPPWDRLPVNLADSRASDIRPVSDIHIGHGVVAAISTNQATRREAWRWFVWGALGVLLLEWVIYTRRMHV